MDFLLSQFTYANWAGNKGDNQTPKRAQRIIYDRLSTQFKILKPKKWIPFASYNYFSHEENFHMNQYVPTMSDIKSFADSKKIDYYFSNTIARASKVMSDCRLAREKNSQNGKI